MLDHSGPGALSAAVQRYFDLMYDSDTSRFDRVFRSSAQLHGFRDGQMTMWPAQTFKELLEGRSSPKAANAPREEEILLIDFASRWEWGRRPGSGPLFRPIGMNWWVCFKPNFARINMMKGCGAESRSWNAPCAVISRGCQHPQPLKAIPMDDACDRPHRKAPESCHS